MSEEKRRDCTRIVVLLRKLVREREKLNQEIRTHNNAIRNLESEITELERRERSLQSPSIRIPQARGRNQRRIPDEEGAQLLRELQRTRDLEQVRSKGSHLAMKLRTHKAELKEKIRKREGKIRNYYEMERRYGANNCADFPETVPLSR